MTAAPLRSEVRMQRNALLLLGAVLLAYGNSFLGIPQYDDYNVIVDYPGVASIGAWWAHMPGMRPLLKLSYALNNSWGGFGGFHLVNLLIHALNAWLGWQLLLRLLPPQHAAAALGGALLFALHPINTEAVTMLSGRSVSMMALFCQLSLLAGLQGRLLLSLLGFAAALATRETALVLPAVMLLLHWWSGTEGVAAAWRASRWHWLLAGLGVVLLLALPRYRELLEVSLGIRSPLENLVTQSGALLYLLGQLLRPWALNADPQLPVFVAWSPWWMLSVATVLIVSLAALAGLQKRRWWAFCVVWLLLCVAPANSLLARFDVANERQLYLAALPLYALPVMAWLAISARAPRAAGVVAGVVLGGLLLSTVWRNSVYYSETAFWSDVVRHPGASSRAWNNLGYALEREHPQQMADALAAYARALALDPSDYKAAFNRQRLCVTHPDDRGCGEKQPDRE